MLNWLLKFIPQEYKWEVAVKKVSWTIAKTGVALLAGTKIGQHVSPDDWNKATEMSAIAVAGGMKLIHDWARMRYPNVKWL